MPERRAFLVRLDPTLLDALQHWADDDLRSLNGQIEFVLRRSLQQSGRAPRAVSAGPEATDKRGRDQQGASRRPGPVRPRPRR